MKLKIEKSALAAWPYKVKLHYEHFENIFQCVDINHWLDKSGIKYEVATDYYGSTWFLKEESDAMMFILRWQ